MARGSRRCAGPRDRSDCARATPPLDKAGLMPSFIIPALLVATLGGLAILHANWARGGVWPASDAAQLSLLVLGDPRHPGMPPPRAIWIVAGALAFAALDALALGAGLGARADQAAAWIGAGLVAVFACRGVAGYTSIWRAAHPGEAFAILDRWFYSPLCILIAEGFFTLASAKL